MIGLELDDTRRASRSPSTTPAACVARAQVDDGGDLAARGGDGARRRSQGAMPGGSSGVVGVAAVNPESRGDRAR